MNSTGAAMIVADRTFAEAKGVEPLVRLAGHGVPCAAAHGLALHLATFSQAMPSTMTTLTMAALDRALRAAWYSGLS